jgi:thioredoxin 1
MSKEIELTESTFTKEVIESAVPVIVDFWAQWCPPCKMIAPFLEQMSVDYDGKAKICKVDVDKEQSLAAKYGVRSIPTLLFFKGGEVQDQVVGALPKDQLVNRLEKLL